MDTKLHIPLISDRLIIILMIMNTTRHNSQQHAMDKPERRDKIKI